MDKVRVGIVGIGNMGTNHAETLRTGKIKNACLAAICDNNSKKLEIAKKNNPDTAAFDNASDMFKSGLIDAVIISTPHYFHPPLGIEAMENGINVLSEKPAGVYTKQVREINETAKKTGLVFAVMFNQRTDCYYRKIKEMVDSGELGKIRRSIWIITNWYRPQSYYDSGDWRATWDKEGGGVLLNQCPHNLDLWQWICGMPSKITAFCKEGAWHDIEVEDDVTAYVEYEDGKTGVFITTTGDTPGTNRLEIAGDCGKLVYENNSLTFFKNKMPESEFTKINKESFGHPDFEEINVETDGLSEQHPAVIQAFVNKILGKGELIARGEEGINALTISNAMHLSSWLGKTIALPIDEDLFYEKLQEKIKNSKVKKVAQSGGVVTDMSSSFAK